MPSTELTKELHKEMLLLLKKFDELCTANDIKYSLHGGTLLGAVREKGFIPWDDDIDITVTRENLDKIKYLFKSNRVPGDMSYDDEFSSAPIIWLCRENGIPVWIDLLVYDYISINPIFRRIKFWGMVFFLGVTKTEDGMKVTREGEYRGKKYLCIYFLYLIGRIIPIKYKNKLKDVFAKYCFTGKRRYMVRSNDQFKALNLCIRTSSIMSYIRVPFENLNLMIHAGYDEILSTSYGKTYMIPVKPEEFNKDTHSMMRKLKK